MDSDDVTMLCQYEVFGHSGEGCNFPFVNSETPPKNMKDRLDVLLASKLSHLSFCITLFVRESSCTYYNFILCRI